MDLIYVDESGDIGTVNSPTAEYLLVAMIVPEESWHELEARITQARQKDESAARLRHGRRNPCG